MEVQPEHSAPPCPSQAILRAFDAGTLASAEHTRLADHITDCEDCETTIRQMADESDTFIRSLAVLPTQDDDEPACQELQSELLSWQAEVGISRQDLRAILDQDARYSGPTQQAPFSLPHTLGVYELLERLGRGATGSVYLARHTKLDRVVAVKVVQPPRGAALNEFLQEMRAVGRLEHPHIIRATDAGDADGYHYLVMEHVGGWDLSRLVRHTGPLQIADACEITRQAALGMQAAHDQGMIHRDIKPSNLLLSQPGSVKLLDLGLVAWDTETTKLARDLPRGTADYMAPEQWQPGTPVTHQADIYGLGCTLFKLLTGEPPFRHLGGDRRHAHLHTQPGSITAVRPDCPPRLEQLVHRMLHKTAADRPGTAEEIALALTPFARQADLRKLAAIWIPGETSESREATTPRKSARVTRRGMLGGAAAATVAGVLLAWQKWKPHASAPSHVEHDWRPLLSEDQPSLFFDEAARQGTHAAHMDWDAQRQAVTIASSARALLPLGRPIQPRYRLRVELRSAGPLSAELAGIFFGGYTEVGTDGELRQKCKTLVVAPPAPGTMPRLLWQGVEWMVHDDPQTQVELWASVELPIWHEQNVLEARFGRSGFPEIFWNQTHLQSARWNVSWQAKLFRRKAPQELTRTLLGKFGLLQQNGTMQFRQPQLMYEA